MNEENEQPTTPDKSANPVEHISIWIAKLERLRSMIVESEGNELDLEFYRNQYNLMQAFMIGAKGYASSTFIIKSMEEEDSDIVFQLEVKCQQGASDE